MLGVLGFAGGIAARASAIRAGAPPGLAVVCGAWKKLPIALKPYLRAALAVAGVGHRLVDGPFVYVDKNAVRLAGGIEAATAAGRRLGHGPVSVQVATADEALRAAHAGAGIVMVDTGALSDLAMVDAALRAAGRRDEVVLAFGGGVTPADLPEARHHGAQVVDMGRAVLNAPLWDLRLELVPI